MKAHRLAIVVLGLAIAGPWHVFGAAEQLTLSEAIGWALEQNAALEARREAVHGQRLAQDEARARRWPEVGLTTNLQHHSEPVLIGPIHEAGSSPPFDDDVASAALRLSLPLYLGGRLAAGETLAREQHVGALADLDREAQDLVYNVVATYAKALDRRSVLAALELRIRSLESEAERIAKEVGQGRAAPLNKVRVETQLSEARHEQVAERQRMEDARTVLAALLGTTTALPPLAPLKRLKLELPRTAEAAVASARSRSPAVREAQAREAASAAGLEMARSERRPQVRFHSELERITGLNAGDAENNWRVGVVLEVPLFDGGVRRKRVAQAEIGRQIGALRVQSMRTAVAAEAQQAFRAVQTAGSRINVAEQAMQESEEALRIEMLRYRHGASTVTELLSAEAAHWSATTRLHAARYDLLTAQVRLLRATGELDGEAIRDAASGQQQADVPLVQTSRRLAVAEPGPVQENAQ